MDLADEAMDDGFAESSGPNLPGPNIQDASIFACRFCFLSLGTRLIGW